MKITLCSKKIARISSAKPTDRFCVKSTPVIYAPNAPEILFIFMFKALVLNQSAVAPELLTTAAQVLISAFRMA